MNKIGWIALGVLIFMVSCKGRELPEEIIGEPDFFISGKIGGENTEIEAGFEDYYMETGFSQDQFEVYALSGKFSVLNCPQCPEELEIIIRDIRPRTAGTPVAIDSAINLTDYPFYIEKGANKAAYRVSFTNESSNSGSGVVYTWDFGDGTQSTGTHPIHDYTDSTLSTVNVCMEAVDPTGCTTTICNEVNLDPPACEVDFTHSLDQTISYVTFFANAQGQPPFDYRWTFGDGFGASLGNPGYFYSNPGLYTVCLEVTDGNGCEASICKNIAADPTYCEHNFTYQVQKTSDPDPIQPGSISIKWRDTDGNLYTSDEDEQPETSFFEILEDEPYQNNEKGEKTRRLKVRFSCEVYRDGEKILLENMEGYLGVAYP